LFDVLPTAIDGCYEIRPRILTDHRGSFSKLFHSSTFKEKGLIHTFSDADYLLCPEDTLRGLHFHPEIERYALLVSCINGRVLEVLVDLRRKSKTYKKVFSVKLDSSSANTLYIPEGVAHGFLSVDADIALITLASHRPNPDTKLGIHWKSIDFDWPVSSPVVSEEDERLMSLADYENRF
jgi:dTDP-4-dehydrorhamnose 3,5-epimerase